MLELLGLVLVSGITPSPVLASDQGLFNMWIVEKIRGRFESASLRVQLYLLYLKHISSLQMKFKSF